MKTTNDKNSESTQNLAILNAKSSMPKVLQMLDEALKNVDQITGTDFVTGGNIEGFSKNLKDEKDMSTLIKMAASIISRERAYNDAASALGLQTFPQFKVNGNHKEEWLKDIKLQIAIITNSDTINKLKTFKDKAAKFLSEEDQKAILFAEMETFLKSTNIIK